MDVAQLGRTTLSVSSLCIGTSALGNFPEQYGYEVDEEQAVRTLRRVFEGPINFIDTSNNYGNGESERRLGHVLGELGGLPDGFVLATKVDPLPGSTDFSGERVRKSVAESLDRLGLPCLQLVYLHDPERITFAEATEAGGAVDTLVALRESGLVKHIGVAGGPVDLMLKYMDLGVFEALISHNRYTIVDRSAEPLIAKASASGVAFVNAAPYGGGILAKGPESQPNYAYAPAGSEVLEFVRAAKRLGDTYDVPLPAIALQFSLRDRRIASTIVGVSAPERLDETLRLATWTIPAELWTELDSLMDARAAGGPVFGGAS